MPAASLGCSMGSGWSGRSADLRSILLTADDGLYDIRVPCCEPEC